MRTNYNNFARRRSRLSFGSVAGIVFVALVVGIALMWRSGASSLMWKLLTPVMLVRNAIDAGQVAELRTELASTTAALADRDVLKAENAMLKARLGRTGVEGHIILAGVLQAPPASAYDTLVIDAGSAQGVAVGQNVSAGGSTIIGAVTDVSSDSARVTLLSAPGTTHDALVTSKQTGATLPISIAGQGGGSFSGQLPTGSTVSTGDSVVFAGVAGQFIAQVVAVDQKPGESFVTIYMHMPVNIFDLQFVEVIH